MANFLFKKTASDEVYAEQFAGAKAAVDEGRPLTNFQAETLGILARTDPEAKEYIFKAFEMYTKWKADGIKLPRSNTAAKARISHLFRIFFVGIKGFRDPNTRFNYTDVKRAILEDAENLDMKKVKKSTLHSKSKLSASGQSGIFSHAQEKSTHRTWVSRR